jgi:channel protein (hemolysin III family)
VQLESANLGSVRKTFGAPSAGLEGSQRRKNVLENPWQIVLPALTLVVPAHGGGEGSSSITQQHLTVGWLGVCQPFASLSHLAAAAVALVAAGRLLRRASGCPLRVTSIAVYAATVTLSLAISGAYHWMAREWPARLVLQRLDHCAIWLLIAGTFTAIHGVMFRGVWRWGVLIFIWSYAAVGILLQAFAFEHVKGVTGLVLYLALGWVGVLSIFKVGRQIGFREARLILLAGLVYSAGALLDAAGRPVLFERWFGPHELFHVAVITGMALHWAFIRRMLIHHVPGQSLAAPDAEQAAA